MHENIPWQYTYIHTYTHICTPSSPIIGVAVASNWCYLSSARRLTVTKCTQGRADWRLSAPWGVCRAPLEALGMVVVWRSRGFEWVPPIGPHGAERGPSLAVLCSCPGQRQRGCASAVINCCRGAKSRYKNRIWLCLPCTDCWGGIGIRGGSYVINFVEIFLSILEKKNDQFWSKNIIKFEREKCINFWERKMYQFWIKNDQFWRKKWSILEIKKMINFGKENYKFWRKNIWSIL